MSCGFAYYFTDEYAKEKFTGNRKLSEEHVLPEMIKDMVEYGYVLKVDEHDYFVMVWDRNWIAVFRNEHVWKTLKKALRENGLHECKITGEEK